MKVDESKARSLGIGGNVRGAGRLKLLAATFDRGSGPEPLVRSVGRGRRTIFAHLKLRADSIEADAFENSPTMRALSEQGGGPAWLRHRLQAEASSVFDQHYSSR